MNLLQTLQDYENKGLLYSQIHPNLPLTIYNYTDKVQWESLWDDVTLMCRGLVVDDLGNVVARPFKKFFNLSEGRTVCTDDYVIFDKMDGSLGVLFFYGGNWIFSSRGSFTSDQAIKGRELLDSVCDYNLLDKNNTYCFEIVYPENRIVVDYDNWEGVVLLAVFDTHTGSEKSPYEYDLLTAQVFDSEIPLHELQKSINDNEEGYVVKFSNGERCKIKGVEYLRLHKIMSEMSTTAVWECLQSGSDITSILSNVPDEYFDKVREYERELKGEFGMLLRGLTFTYEMAFANTPTAKELAEKIRDNKFKHFYFSLYNGKDITQAIWKHIKPKYRRL